MNTQHLMYLIEIERACSISRAADSLFISQPQLSRIVSELESNLGYQIFERTRRGVRPTARGASFLRHAKNIVHEMNMIESIGPRHSEENRLRICIPRSAPLFQLLTDYLAAHPREGAETVIRECHARQTLEIMGQGEAEIGIIRFRNEYREYFEECVASARLEMQRLNRYSYEAVLSRGHPLAGKESLQMADLKPFTEITHGDRETRTRKADDQTGGTIYTVDRMAQVTLLNSIDGSYLMAERMEPRLLQQWGLVQMPVTDNDVVYHNVLVLHCQYEMSGIEKNLTNYLLQHYGKRMEL